MDRKTTRRCVEDSMTSPNIKEHYATFGVMFRSQECGPIIALSLLTGARLLECVSSLSLHGPRKHQSQRLALRALANRVWFLAESARPARPVLAARPERFRPTCRVGVCALRAEAWCRTHRDRIGNVAWVCPKCWCGSCRPTTHSTGRSPVMLARPLFAPRSVVLGIASVGRHGSRMNWRRLKERASMWKPVPPSIDMPGLPSSSRKLSDFALSPRQ